MAGGWLIVVLGCLPFGGCPFSARGVSQSGGRVFLHREVLVMSDEVLSQNLGQIGNVIFRLVLHDIEVVATGFNSTAFNRWVQSRDRVDSREVITECWSNGEILLECGDDDRAAESLLTDLVWEGLWFPYSVGAVDHKHRFGEQASASSYLRLEFLPFVLAELQLNHYDTVEAVCVRAYRELFGVSLPVG